MSDECFPYDNIKEFQRVTQELNTYKDIDAILEKILLEARLMARADAGSIFLLGKKNLRFSYVQNDTLFNHNRGIVELYTDLIVPIDNTSIVGYTAAAGKGVVIDDAYTIPEEMPYRFNPDFDEQSGYHTHSVFTIPLQTLEARTVGIMELINATDTQGNPIPFNRDARVFIPLFANHAALAIERGIMNRELILRMVRMAQLRDPTETGDHVQRVGAYSAEIFQQLAQKRGMPPRKIRRTKDLIRLAAMLHDIGKIGIHDNILKKPARLTSTEFHTMKWHPVHGARLFTHSTSDLDDMSRKIILHHHEKWDGSGYPGKIKDLWADIPETSHALKGKDIPLPARITALADVFDALASRRSYKKPWSHDRILTTISTESGRHFDPEVVDAFLDIQDVIAAIGNRYKD